MGVIPVAIAGCDLWNGFDRELSYIPNSIRFEEKLSGYGLFRGEISQLTPASGIVHYTLSTPLFTDHAKKQRLLKLPAGSSMKAAGEGLPVFPDGTLLAKTFYYPANAADPETPGQILETRLLIRKSGQWNAGVYIWNDQQNEAYLIKEGAEKDVQWITEDGVVRKISYHIPSQSECTTCHQSSGKIVPIGPKLRNLNVHGSTSQEGISQLTYWRNRGWLELDNPSGIETLPNWKSTSFSLPERARAYLDVNCAHCHSRGGFASDKRLNLAYDVPFAQTGIAGKKYHLPARMESGWADEKMPMLGTTLLHKEGLELIEKYIESL